MNRRSFWRRAQAAFMTVLIFAGCVGGGPEALAVDQTDFFAQSERIVYVAEEETAVPSQETVYGSLEDAMIALSEEDSTSDAVIVVVGTVGSSVSFNLNGTESHTGTYYITGQYGEYSGGKLVFSKNTGSNYNFGGPVVLQNITLNQTKDKVLNLHAAASLTVEDNVITDGYTEKINIVGGSYDKDVADTEIQIHSGTWGAVRAGNNTSDITGTSVVTVDGSAQIDTLAASGNGAVHTANAIMNVDGGTIGQIFVTGTDTDASAGNVSITLQAGVVQEDIKACAGGNVTGNLDITLSSGVELGENFTINLAGCALQGVSELYLDGVNELPSYAGQFDEVYSSSAGEDNPVIVYVDGTVSASGNGQSAAAAFRDLEEAYAYLENHAAIRGGTIIVCGDLMIGGNVDLESNYNILGIVEITSCYGEEDFTSAATITFEAGATLYPTSRTWIHDITCYSEGVTYLYTGTDMVLGENIDAAASAAKNGLKVFCAEKSGSNTAQVNVTVNGGTYHSIYMGGNTGSTAGNITLTMNGGTVTTYFVMGPNSSERKPSVSGNLTFQMNGGSISTLCDTPNIGGQTGEVAMYLTGGSIGTAMKSYGSGGQIMEKVIVYLDASFGKLPAVFGDWDGSSVTNGTTLNLAGYSGEVPFSGFDVVNLEENSHVSYADALNDQNITVEAGCTLTLAYPGYTGPEKLPEDVCLAAAEGGTSVWTDGGKVFYTEQEYPYVVYVSGDAAQSGDGMTAENAVKTLPEGYALLDPEAGGTIVVCGETEISTDTNLEEFEIEGQVELTSVYQGSNYAASNDAALVFQGKRYIYFGDNTYIHDLTLTTGSETVYVFCGSHLILGERIICHQNNTLKLFCCDSTPSASASSAKDFSLTVSSGDFDSVWMGGLTANTYVGDVDVTIKETAVLRLLVMGANKGNTGNLTVNVRGGTIQKVCNTPAASGARVENVVINFFGGSVESMVSYNDSPHYGLSATVNIHMSTAGNIPSSLGDWDAFYLPGTTSRLPVALNYLCYNGSAVTPGDFDTVRLFGTDILPESFTTASAGGERLLCIHAYEGVTSVDLSLFDRVAVTGDSDVTCVGVVPVSLVLLVDNSVLRIRPSQNPGVVLTDYTIQNNDTVLLEEPPYVEYEEILRMDFENGYALSSGASAVVVEPVQNGYVTSFAQGGFAPGYDGNTSLYFVNEFGENAQNYISFDLSNSGFDMTNEDYSILFWYKTENGGNDQWARAVHSTVAQTEVEMSSYVMGGTIFSNQDVRLDSDGMSLLQLTHYKYLASGVTDEEGEHYDADGIWQAQDDTWHHVAVSCDRDGYYSVYVDGELIAATNISACSDDSLGANVLVFGADALGQFGLGNAYIDDIVVYRGALNLLDIQARYEMDRIYALAFEIETRLEQLGSEYDPYRVGMEGELQSAIEQAEALDAEDFADMLSLYYDLKTCYEAFLSAPEENANLAVLLTSDIHLGSSGTSENLNRVLSQLQELGVEIDVLLSAGDFANAPYDQTIEEAYEYLYQLLDTYQMTDTLFVNALGNHDAYYKSASANYQTAVPLYWQYMMEHMEEMIEEETVTLDHASYYVDEDGILQSCSYAVTFQGYHFLVINTDYVPQTGNSGLVLDENGDYSIEGNEVDPIRHTLHISEESFSWMEEILDAWSEDGKPIFAVSHYLFENTAPLSFDSEIIINSNTIGEQDQQLRELLADYENVFYFCGHLHASFGVIEPYQVVVEDGGSFWEINLSSLKASARGYLPVPSTWLLYVYEDEMVLRARDFASGKWLTQFDQVLELSVQTAEKEKSVGYALPYAEGAGPGRPAPETFESDTTEDLTVQGVYQFRITSLNGAEPVMRVSSDCFRVEMVSRSGSDYFFKVFCTGDPGSKAAVLVNDRYLLTVTAGNSQT